MAKQHKHRILNSLLGLTISDTITQAAIGSSFIYFLRDGLSFLSNPFFKFLNAPLAIFASVIDIIFAWRLFHLEKTRYTLTNAIVHTLTSLALITAAIGLTIGVTVLSAIAPILFAATMGAQCLYQTSSAIYFYYKAHTTSGYFNEKNAFRRMGEEAIGNAMITGILTAASVALLLMAAPVAQIILASIALATSIAAIIYCSIKSYRLASAKNQVEKHQFDLYSTAVISTGLNYRLSKGFAFDGFSFELPTIPAPAATVAHVSEMTEELIHRYAPPTP